MSDILERLKKRLGEDYVASRQAESAQSTPFSVEGRKAELAKTIPEVKNVLDYAEAVGRDKRWGYNRQSAYDLAVRKAREYEMNFDPQRAIKEALPRLPSPNSVTQMGWGADYRSTQARSSDNAARRMERYEQNQTRIEEIDEQLKGRSYSPIVKTDGGYKLEWVKTPEHQDEYDKLSAERSKLQSENDMYHGAGGQYTSDLFRRGVANQKKDDSLLGYDVDAMSWFQDGDYERYYNDSAFIRWWMARDPEREGTNEEYRDWQDEAALLNSSGQLYSNLEYLTNEELQDVFYILHKQGPEEADKFLRDMRTTLDGRANQEARETYDSASPAAKAVGNVLSVPASVFSAPASVLGNVQDIINTGKVNPYNLSNAGRNFAQNVRSSTSRDIDQATGNKKFLGVSLGDVYQSGMSTADSFVGAFTTGGAYTVLMGMSAAASEMERLAVQDAPTWKVVGGGLASGAIEWLTEKYSFESFLSKFMSGETSKLFTRETIKNLLLQGASEASEEVMSELGNALSDVLFNGDRAEILQSMYAHINEGESKEKALSMAIGEKAVDAWQAAVGGFLSGGMMGAGGAVINSAGSPSYTQVGNDVIDNDSASILRGLATDLASEESGIALGDKAAKKITRAAENYDKRGTARSLGKLATTVQGEVAQANSSEITNAVKEAGLKGEDAKNAEAIFTILAETPNFELSDEDAAFIQRDDVNAAYNKLFGDTLTRSVGYNSLGGSDASLPTTEDIVEDMKRTSDVERRVREKAAEKVSYNQGMSEAQAARIARNARTEYAFADKGVRTEPSIPGVGRKGNEVVADAKERGVDIEPVVAAYNQGVKGEELTVRETKASPEIGESIQKQAYNAGVLDAATEKANVEKYGKAVANDNPGLDMESVKKANVKYTSGEILRADALGKVTGTKVEIVKDLTDENGKSVNALYDAGTATIKVSAKATSPFMAALAHETVHRIRDVSEDAYKSLKRFVIANMSKEKLTAAMGVRGVAYGTFDEDFVSEETVADAFGDILDADPSAIDELVKDDRNLGEKIRDVIRDLIIKIDRYLNRKRDLKKMTAEERKAWEEERAEFAELRKKLVQAESRFSSVLNETVYSLDMQEKIEDAGMGVDENAVKAEEKPVSYSIDLRDAIAARSIEAAKQRDLVTFGEALVEATEKQIDILAADVEKRFKGKTDKNGLPFLPEEEKLSNNIFANSSYLKDAEPTTECWRQMIYRELNRKVTDKLGRPLTAKEAIIVNQAAIEIGVDAPCIYCYSLLDRKAKEGYKLQYLAERDAFLEELDKQYEGDVERFRAERAKVFQKYYDLYLDRTSDPSAYDENGEYQKGKKRTPNASKEKRVNLWMDVYEKLYANGEALSANDIRNYETEAETKKAFSQISDAEIRALKLAELKDALDWAQASSQAKKIIPYAAYSNLGKDSILNWKKATVDRLNSEYGLRWYSHADYHPAFTIDNMQQVVDASILGLKGLMYCKPIEAAKIFAPTGMNINVSCFAQYDETTGRYIQDDKLGAPWKQVQELRNKYRNVGAVMVVTSDDQMMWALTQGWVDVVIPLHLVRSGDEFVKEFGLTNYSAEQADKLTDKQLYDKFIADIVAARGLTENGKAASAIRKENKSIYPKQHQNNYAKYMDELGKRGLTARFDRIRQAAVNGELSYMGVRVTPQMYMKLVNETRQSEGQTRPLQPKFDFSAARNAMLSLKQKGYNNFFKDAAVNPEDGKVYDVDGWADIAVRDIKAGKTGSQVGYGRDLKTEVTSRREARESGVGGVHDNPKEVRYSRAISPEDSARYLELAKDPEANEAELSRMVEEAARAAGYDSPMLYSGTDAFGYTVIDTSVPEADGFSYWASNDKDTSATYTKYGKVRRINQEITEEDLESLVEDANEELDEAISDFHNQVNKYFSEWFLGGDGDGYLKLKILQSNSEPGLGDGAYDVLTDVIGDAWERYGEEYHDKYEDFADWQERSAEWEEIEDSIISVEDAYRKYSEIGDEVYGNGDFYGGIYELYANTDNMYVLDGKGKTWQNLRSNDFPKLDKPWKKDAPYTTRDVANWSRAQGYDGVIFKNIRDFGQYGVGDPSDVYAFFNPNAQVKSADPVTYDDQGNVIPLEERFNPENEDIRYSRDLSEARISPDKEINPTEIEPVNEITSQEQYKYLVDEFKKNGWSGRPIVVVENGNEGYRALTGSHRIYAAKEADIKVPAVVINQFDGVDELLDARDDVERADVAERFASEGLIREDVANLITREDELNDENWGIPFNQQTRYSRDLTESYEEYRRKYGTIPQGERPFRDVAVPERTAKGNKVAQTVRTVLEAEATPETMVPTIKEMIADGDFSYDVYTDEAALANAAEDVKKAGFADALTRWTRSVARGKVNKTITAEGWALYNAAAAAGDTEAALTILRNMVANTRSAAQALQATRILKKLSPEAQLYNVVKTVDQLIKDAKDRYGRHLDITVDPDLAEDFLNARSQEERDRILQKIYKVIAQQLPTRFIDRWNAWRYLAMLGNPRTHIRNIFGNALFAPIVMTKNAFATGIEAVVSRASGGKLDRTKANIVGRQGAALLSAARDDYTTIQDEALGERKYSDASQQMVSDIEKYRSRFGGTKWKVWNKTGGAALDWLNRKNSEALDKEDVVFSRPHYAIAMAQYCKAHGITAEQIRSGKGLDAARAYAIKEAQKATYRDTNVFSQAVSRLGRKNAFDNKLERVGKTLVEGILPFRKTPANILVRGVEYSPLGLLKAMTTDIAAVRLNTALAMAEADDVNVRIENNEKSMRRAYVTTGMDLEDIAAKTGASLESVEKMAESGKWAAEKADYRAKLAKAAKVLTPMTGAEMIDHLSAGLTGTGLVTLGALLASFGLVRGHGKDDDKEEKFDQLTGHQNYALELPNGISITLDWLAPESLPFFVGVNLFQELQNQDQGTLEDLLTAIGNTTEPFIEMSCLQSLNDLLDSIGYAKSKGVAALPSILVSMATSYISQGLPTIGGQIKRIIEDKRMTTFTDKKGAARDLQYQLGKASAKIPIPGVDYNQIPYIDAWGREESTGVLPYRAFSNFVNPAYVKQISADEVEQELLRVYEGADKDGGVFPSRAEQPFTVNGQEFNLNAQEFVKYATVRGQTSYETVGMLTKNDAYKDLPDADKAAAIKDAYSYATVTARTTVGAPYPTSSTYSWIPKAAEANRRGITPDVYILVKNAVSNIDSVKGADGKTIDNSKGLLTMEYIYGIPGLTNAQKRYLFDVFNVGKKVIGYSQSQVENALREMRGK